MSDEHCTEILNHNKPRDGEKYVMECRIEAERTEVLGNAETKVRVKWDGFATEAVVNKMLGLFGEVVVER